MNDRKISSIKVEYVNDDFEYMNDIDLFDPYCVLKNENQELKGKLKATKEVAVEHLKKEIELKAHQKEFIEWLKQNIENEEYCYLSQNPSERCRKDVFEEVLSKHKEIVGE